MHVSKSYLVPNIIKRCVYLYWFGFKIMLLE